MELNPRYKIPIQTSICSDHRAARATLFFSHTQPRDLQEGTGAPPRGSGQEEHDVSPTPVPGRLMRLLRV